MFLMNGTSDDLPNNTLTENLLINQFRTIEQMTEHDKDVVKNLIDGFIIKAKIKQLELWKTKDILFRSLILYL